MSRAIFKGGRALPAAHGRIPVAGLGMLVDLSQCGGIEDDALLIRWDRRVLTREVERRARVRARAQFVEAVEAARRVAGAARPSTT